MSQAEECTVWLWWRTVKAPGRLTCLVLAHAKRDSIDSEISWLRVQEYVAFIAPAATAIDFAMTAPVVFKTQSNQP